MQRKTWKLVVLSLCGVLLVGAGAAWSARLVLLNEYLGSTDPDYSADIAYRPDGMNIDEFMGAVFARSACAGRMQRIEKLVRFGVKPGQGNLDEALRCAAANGHAETASYMIRKGADANVFSRELHPGERLPRTALQSAVANKHPDLVELLLANGAQVDLQETGADGRVRPGALHFAAMNKDSAMMATLIRAGARRDAPGPMAPVFYFMEASTTDARTGRAEWSATITAAERAGLSLTGLDADGGNLLHWAASRGESALIELLLERQLDRLRQDKGGAYAFQRLAAWYERRDIEPGPEYDFVLKALAAGVRDINLASRLSQPVVGGSQTESGWTIARAAVAKPRVRAIFGKDVNYAMLDATSSQMGWPFRDQQQAEQLVADLTPAQLAAAITLPTALRSRSWEDLAQLVERKRRF